MYRHMRFTREHSGRGISIKRNNIIIVLVGLHSYLHLTEGVTVTGQ